MNCDLCGKSGRLFKAEIEGARVNACEKCATHGKIFHEIKQETPKDRIREEKKVREMFERKDSSKKETIQLIVKDYSQRIKNAREKRGLKQEDFAKSINEKESMIHQLESGSMMPSMILAKKLELSLGIKLIEEYVHEEESKKDFVKSSGPLTLGDMINIKKRK